MNTTNESVPTIETSFTEDLGIIARQARDSELGIVRGYKAASNPDLVAARKVANDARTSAITAKLLADLQP
jgi:hypothetical protein